MISAGGDSPLVGAGGDGGEDSLRMQQDHYDKNAGSSEVTAHADEQPLGNDVPKSCKKSGRYFNPWPTWKSPFLNPMNLLHWVLFSPNNSNVPSKQIDTALLCNPREDGLQVTWIGHATVLVQMEGLNILTDPLFSERVLYGGTKRYRKAPCTVDELPEVHAVVISHSHADHLDYYSVRAINSRFGCKTWWFVPAGLRTWMESTGCENVIELEWDKESCVPDHPNVRFVFTPTQHWTTRTFFDRDKSLWGSWCILGSWQRFYFAGDTGYCAVFKQIGKKYGPFDLAAIPIGAYEPRWFMKYQHINPSEAVQIHKDLQAKQSLGIHWGTFALSNEFYLEPPQKMKEALQEQDLPPDVFFTLGHGETKCIGDSCNTVD